MWQCYVLTSSTLATKENYSRLVPSTSIQVRSHATRVKCPRLSNHLGPKMHLPLVNDLNMNIKLRTYQKIYKGLNASKTALDASQIALCHQKLLFLFVDLQLLRSLITTAGYDDFLPHDNCIPMINFTRKKLRQLQSSYYQNDTDDNRGPHGSHRSGFT